MQWISISVFALLTVGIVAMSGLRFEDVWTIFNDRKKTTLQDDLSIVTGKPRKGFWNREFTEIHDILKSTGREGKFDFFKKLCLVLFGVGVLASILIGNLYLIPVLGIGFALMPIWYIRSTASSYKKNLNEELETALSAITTSYLRTEDIVRSVEDNLQYINGPIHDAFEQFLTETHLINANVTSALNSLKLRIPNAIAHEWIGTLIMCQSDRTMKNMLIAQVQKFSDVRVVQAEFESLLSAPRKEAITMMFLVVSNIPLLYFLNRDWYHTLVYTTPGQITLAICAGIILFAMARIIRLSRPIEYRG